MDFPYKLGKTVFTPGPSEVPEAVWSSIISHKTYHRSDEFRLLFKNLLEKLSKLFLTEYEIVVLTCSGSGAMEVSVVNFCNKNDKVLYINQGKFGKRWGEICITYGIQADEVFIEPGYAPQIADFESYDLEKYNAVFLTQSETSTATLTDIKSISNYIHKNSNALVIVDAITSVCAIEFRMDEWGIDIAVSASQKGFMCPPGLSIVAFSEKAKKKLYNSDMNRYYFDLRKELESKKDFLTSWTPSIVLFYGLNTASEMILNEGLENRWNRTSQCAAYFRDESVKLGFGIFSHNPTDSLTALSLPHNLKSDKIIKSLFEHYGVFVANGQGELRNKIIRVSHMGNLVLEDFEVLIKIFQKELGSQR